MFNFKDLKLDKRIDDSKKSSFVGIRRDENKELVFRLPIGFKDFPENEFNETKCLFFRMYRTFKKFEQDIKEKLKEDDKPSGKDQIEKAGNAYKFNDSDEEPVILYSKIRMLENIFKAYNELALNIIEKRIGRSDKIDYARIDKYLHKAIYLSNGFAYIDEMEVPQNVILYESNDLIEMFCFILCEVQRELEQEIDESIKALAKKFQEKHLSAENSLFNEHTFEFTIAFLKDILEKIDKQMAYKDNDYWQLFEAVETFLYGELDLGDIDEDGNFWGISRFDVIWEQMCDTYAFRNFNDIVYADTNVSVSGKRVSNKIVGGHDIFVADNFQNPFYIEFRKDKRWLRPDMVRDRQKDIIGNIIEIKIYEKSHTSGIVNFEIILKDKKYKDLYDDFIYQLKQEMKRKRMPGAVFKDKKFFTYSYKTLQNISKQWNSFIVVDWKYIRIDEYTQNSLNSKAKSDVIKQLLYELCLQDQFPNYKTKSQFVVPYFYPPELQFSDGDNTGEFVKDSLLNLELKNNKIRVFKANFSKIQQEYLLEW